MHVGRINHVSTLIARCCVNAGHLPKAADLLANRARRGMDPFQSKWVDCAAALKDIRRDHAWLLGILFFHEIILMRYRPPYIELATSAEAASARLLNSDGVDPCCLPRPAPAIRLHLSPDGTFKMLV
ncbi:hypothetical protein [Methylobacterium sp. 17Sr1-1]|uniref:hypothetical protein n=1 Tax=Methylobacterium sp. 17Sr1-1 TaxID=2202826 RepID=UPI0013A57666|nr:hypothetical protein [Methylobacterium sp. 17Sr1-1]